MQTSIIIHKDYTLSSSNYQFKPPFELEILIPNDDPVRLLSVFVEGLKLTDLYQTYGASRYRAPIRLTAEGKEIARLLKSRADQVLESAGRGMDDEMRSHMYKCLDIIAQNMKEISEKEQLHSTGITKR